MIKVFDFWPLETPYYVTYDISIELHWWSDVQWTFLLLQSITNYWSVKIYEKKIPSYKFEDFDPCNNVINGCGNGIFKQILVGFWFNNALHNFNGFWVVEDVNSGLRVTCEFRENWATTKSYNSTVLVFFVLSILKMSKIFPSDP